MTTSASTLSAAAAKAAACAWVPALIAITPRRFSLSLRLLILFSAPRDLNEPVRWNSSAFSRAPIVRLESMGVRTRRSPIVMRACSTSARVGIIVVTVALRRGALADGFEEQHGGGV